MNDQNRSGRRRGRGCLLWLVKGMAILLALLLVGYVVEPGAEAADAKTYPPPGELVDVGGHRLHIHCTGSGSPVVVIEAGLGDWSTSWGPVQAEVAKTTRVCTYDRAGMGWSEAGPPPRDAAQFAKELHTLLQNAEVPGPYILVGHSLGGLGVRVFAHEYASEVAGVVLVESMNPRQLPPASTKVGPQSNPQSTYYSVLAVLARTGVARLIARPLIHLISPGDLPDEDAYYSRFVRTGSMLAARDESRGLQDSATEAAAVQDFGDLPLIVLTGRLHSDPPDWQTWQTELLQLSSHSQQLFAEHAGHGIQTDEPEAAEAAILQMVRQLRQTAQK